MQSRPAVPPPSPGQTGAGLAPRSARAGRPGVDAPPRPKLPGPAARLSGRWRRMGMPGRWCGIGAASEVPRGRYGPGDGTGHGRPRGDGEGRYRPWDSAGTGLAGARYGASPPSCPAADISWLAAVISWLAATSGLAAVMGLA